MRNYLFRAKNIYGTWCYGSLINVKDYCCILEETNKSLLLYPKLDSTNGYIDGYATPIDPETIGQFTGIYDKNCKKIFEGDIVRAMMDYGPAGMRESIVEIYWDTFHGWQLEYFDISSIEVIGNVHDNPGLFKVE